MNIKDISTIKRFLGVIEGVAVSLPKSTNRMVFDYIETIDYILDEEEKEHLGEKGGVQE